MPTPVNPSGLTPNFVEGLWGSTAKYSNSQVDVTVTEITEFKILPGT